MDYLFSENFLRYILVLIPLMPLVGFLINGLFGSSLPKFAVYFVGCVFVFLSFVFSILIFFFLVYHNPDGVLSFSASSWFSFGINSVDYGFFVDSLTSVFLLVVTGVGFLIHIYSIGYMKDDPGVSRFFSYMNCFVASMLILIVSDNLVFLFLGWEGVGLCSYLLISFWYKNNNFIASAKKAFIINRIGDAAFIGAIFIAFVSFGSVNFSVIEDKIISGVSTDHLTLICFLLFIGVTAKSAQIPLYTWLPDAMAGPTPVSALIHAATMVTAGVYLIVRLDVLFISSPSILMLIGIVAAATSFIAGYIALSQDDIKKVLAYSTVSQLGFMFMALSVGAWSTGVFHVVTHAFFKAALFLSAGSIILALHNHYSSDDERQNIRNMGGLFRFIPLTAICFYCGSFALVGFFPFSGFFSKDQIFEYIYHQSIHGDIYTWFILISAVISALLTAAYTFRLLGLVFHGSPAPKIAEKAVKETSSLSVLGVIISLAGLSFFGGWLGVPSILGDSLSMANFIDDFLASSMESIHLTSLQGSDQAVSSFQFFDWFLLVGLFIGSVIVSFIFIMLFKSRSLFVSKFKSSILGNLMHIVSRKKFYIDYLYMVILVYPFFYLSKILWKVFEQWLMVRVLMDGFSLYMRSVSSFFQLIQRRYVQIHALFVVSFLVLILILILFVYK